MRAVLTDLDRTLTGPDLVLDPRVLPRFRSLRNAGIEVVVVSGRTMPHLVDLGFTESASAIVAENGALVAVPASAPPRVCDASFRARACATLGPLADAMHWGEVVGSGPRKLEREVARLVETGELKALVSFNAEELMLLPPGIDKARGALDALAALGIPPSEAVAIGDGENDVALFSCAGRSAAVANAHPALKAAASQVLRGAYAEGFLELSDALLREAR